MGDLKAGKPYELSGLAAQLYEIGQQSPRLTLGVPIPDRPVDSDGQNGSLAKDGDHSTVNALAL